MKDFIAGPASGVSQGGTGLGGGGTPPTVLIAALGAAMLIAATLVGLLLSSSGGGDTGASRGLGNDASGPAATAAGDAKRVLLTVQFDGGGTGRLVIDPRGITCADTCKRPFVLGERVTLSPDPDTGSHFDGWSEACTGKGHCSLVMDRPREITVTFEGTPAAAQCSDGRDNDGDGLIDEADPGCDADNTEAPDNRPAASASDCHDGRDNDGDGLVDAAQDPGCANGGSEAGSGAPSTTTAPPPPPAASPKSQCSDGRDNDGDGLVDAADPGCASGGTEGGAAGTSECSDGRDNDGDGLVDRPADPGCDANGTEAGPP